jgi:trimethylamine:corrinoid methyltransferase-like protein
MDDIAEQCEDLNVAQDFVTIGGLPVITTSLLSSTPDIVWRAADIVAILTQNHPKCQEQSHANNIMNLVVPLLKHDNNKVRALITCPIVGSNADLPAVLGQAEGNTSH